MNNESVFLYILGAVALCFGIANLICLLLKYNRTDRTVGTIMSIKMPNPETAKTRNSKWATVSYKVDGRIYQSQNRIQVPMASQIGSTIKIRYDKLTPEKLYSFSVLRIVISFISLGQGSDPCPRAWDTGTRPLSQCAT